MHLYDVMDDWSPHKQARRRSVNAGLAQARPNKSSLLHGLAVNMARYCTSVQKYFPEPKARENTAYECNVSPY